MIATLQLTSKHCVIHIAEDDFCDMQSTTVRKQIKQQVESASAALIKSYTRQSAAQTMSSMNA